jgi:hypothetical protein
VAHEVILASRGEKGGWMVGLIIGKVESGKCEKTFVHNLRYARYAVRNPPRRFIQGEKKTKQRMCEIYGIRKIRDHYHSRATQSLLRDASSIELSVVQNTRSVALRPVQLF